MILMATGHRPEYLICKYDEKHPWLINLKDKLYAFLHHHRFDIEFAISGMALGWDTWFAEECLKLRIPLHAYIPFVGQEERWSFSAQKRYKDIIKACDKINLISRNYSKSAFLERNKAMINNTSHIAALWNPKMKTGGTFFTINFAQKNNLPIYNFWKGSAMYNWR